MALLRKLSALTVAATYCLVVIGGIVRITESGLGCPDWPLCHGQVIPPFSIPTMIEFSHRIFASGVSILILALVALLWRLKPTDRWIRVPGVLLLLILGVQVVLGGVTVLFELPPPIIVAHLGTGMTLFGALVMLTAATMIPAAEPGKLLGGRANQHAKRYRRLVVSVTMMTFVLLLSGGTVAATNADGSCGNDFPRCLGQWAPFGISPLTDIQLFHRLMAMSVAVLVGWLIWQTYRERRQQPVLLRTAMLAGVLVLVQAGIGATYVLSGLHQFLAGLHLAVATLVWATMVTMTVLAYRLPVPEVATSEAASAMPAAPGVPTLLQDYVTLTKPRIISLLLLTTIAPMIVAQGGMPPLSLILWTMVGGYLAAGGANAINMFYDRDIDTVMTRTRKRPVASQRMTPTHALLFGLTLTGLSFAVFALFVNVLAGFLALCGTFYYVVIYTHWLKRSSPQNVVIGGGAGAVPPLVGYAAVANDINLLAVWLFIIIFYWTPPHFWALALIRRVDYERAGVPMLPVVYGEAETKKQIILYSLILVAVTLVLPPFQMMGLIYLFSAAILGAIWLFYALRILRSDNVESAWGLYKYSLLYLALLFIAMAADRVVA